MKRAVKIAAAIMAAVMLLATVAGCSLIEFDSAAFNKSVVSRVGDKEITMGDMLAVYNIYKSMYGITADNENTSMRETSLTLKKQVINMLTQEEVIRQMAAKNGVNTATEDEKKKAEAAVQKQLDDMLKEYLEKYEGQEDAQQKAEQDLKEAMEASGISRETMLEGEYEKIYKENLRDSVVKDVTVDDAAIKTYYDSDAAAGQEEKFKGSTSTYETAYSNGDPLTYNLEGYVRVKHILVSLPEKVVTDIKNKRAGNDTEGANKLRDEELAKIKAEADKVLAATKDVKDQAGFDKMMDEYSDDANMLSDSTSKIFYEHGYLINKDSTRYSTEFNDAALKLANPGDMTELVGTDSGYHIIYLVAKQKAGKLTLEESTPDIREYLVDKKQEELWLEQLGKWGEELGNKIYLDLL